MFIRQTLYNDYISVIDNSFMASAQLYNITVTRIDSGFYNVGLNVVQQHMWCITTSIKKCKWLNVDPDFQLT